MPIYYHIHRSIKKSNIENKFKEGKCLFFSKKNSFWYNLEKYIALYSYDGYSEYKIIIPQKYFTTSLNPKKKNKILKLTPKNIEKFIILNSKFLKSSKSLRDEYINKNFIGIDATNKNIFLNSKLKLEPQLYPPQGWITKKYKDIIIEKVNIVSSK